jgi:hypothetical protein
MYRYITDVFEEKEHMTFEIFPCFGQQLSPYCFLCQNNSPFLKGLSVSGGR